MSLKDALLKAGLKPTKAENERQRKPKKVKTKREVHQETRNYCEVCNAIYPDVEKYLHKKPTLDARWICVNCADKNEIHDQFRVTAQSEFSKTNRFKRFYGPTLKPEQNDLERKFRSQKDRASHSSQSSRSDSHRSSSHRVNGNRSHQNQKRDNFNAHKTFKK